MRHSRPPSVPEVPQIPGQKLVYPMCPYCGAGYRTLRCLGEKYGRLRYLLCRNCGSNFKVVVERPEGLPGAEKKS